MVHGPIISKGESAAREIFHDCQIKENQCSSLSHYQKLHFVYLWQDSEWKTCVSVGPEGV